MTMPHTINIFIMFLCTTLQIAYVRRVQWLYISMDDSVNLAEIHTESQVYAVNFQTILYFHWMINLLWNKAIAELIFSFTLPVGLSESIFHLVQMSLAILGMMKACSTRQQKYHNCSNIPNSCYCINLGWVGAGQKHCNKGHTSNKGQRLMYQSVHYMIALIFQIAATASI